jgi:hypothetical protein
MTVARVLLFSLLFSASLQAQELAVPTLFFNYSALYDSVCGEHRKVDPEWVTEFFEKKPALVAKWDADSALLFGKIFEKFGKGFLRKELTATVSVCEGAPSMSEPLILNVTRFLKSFMNDRPVQTEMAFVDLVFHELLHTWIVENVPLPTPLMKKYSEELPSVRAHLHLMALQVFVYTKLNRQDMLDWIAKKYPAMQGVYARAWSIVQDEGWEKFIDEIPSTK